MTVKRQVTECSKMASKMIGTIQGKNAKVC